MSCEGHMVMYMVKEDMLIVLFTAGCLKTHHIKAVKLKLRGKMDPVPPFPFLFQIVNMRQWISLNVIWGAKIIVQKWLRTLKRRDKASESKQIFRRLCTGEREWCLLGRKERPCAIKSWSVICPWESAKGKSWVYRDHCSQQASPGWASLLRTELPHKFDFWNLNLFWSMKNQEEEMSE